MTAAAMPIRIKGCFFLGRFDDSGFSMRIFFYLNGARVPLPAFFLTASGWPRACYAMIVNDQLFYFAAASALTTSGLVLRLGLSLIARCIARLNAVISPIL